MFHYNEEIIRRVVIEAEVIRVTTQDDLSVFEEEDKIVLNGVFSKEGNKYLCYRATNGEVKVLIREEKPSGFLGRVKRVFDRHRSSIIMHELLHYAQFLLTPVDKLQDNDTMYQMEIDSYALQCAWEFKPCNDEAFSRHANSFGDSAAKALVGERYGFGTMGFTLEQAKSDFMERVSFFRENIKMFAPLHQRV